mmetsp:Transcript_75492/g.137954  ORF Transcript_75492/g.137954 Transcript_75492/m.137954 type:complete len:487 (-) Transcript_75492:44-1504(-)
MPLPEGDYLAVTFGTRLDVVERRVDLLLNDVAEIAESRAVIEVRDRLADVETSFFEFGSRFMKYQENLTMALVKHLSRSEQMQPQEHAILAQEAVAKEAEQVMREINGELELMRDTLMGSRRSTSDARSSDDTATWKEELETTASTVCLSEDMDNTQVELKRLMDEARKDIDGLYSDLRTHQLASEKRFFALEFGSRAQKKQDSEQTEKPQPTLWCSKLKAPADAAAQSAAPAKCPRAAIAETEPEVGALQGRRSLQGVHHKPQPTASPRSTPQPTASPRGTKGGVTPRLSSSCKTMASPRPNTADCDTLIRSLTSPLPVAEPADLRAPFKIQPVVVAPVGQRSTSPAGLTVRGSQPLLSPRQAGSLTAPSTIASATPGSLTAPCGIASPASARGDRSSSPGVDRGREYGTILSGGSLSSPRAGSLRVRTSSAAPSKIPLARTSSHVLAGPPSTPRPTLNMAVQGRAAQTSDQPLPMEGQRLLVLL